MSNQALQKEAGYACRVCKMGLQMFEDEYGQLQVAHIRPWEPQDHEPEPVPASTVADRVRVCDFCGALGAVWQYHGSNLHDVLGAMGAHDIDGIWSACTDCDSFVRRNDLDGLEHHFLTSSSSAAIHTHFLGDNVPDDIKTKALAAQRRLWRAFVDSITHRSPVPVYKPLPAMRPAQMPKIRDRLVEFFDFDIAQGGMMRDLENTGSLVLPGEIMGQPDQLTVTTPNVTTEQGNAMFQRIQRQLRAAELFWIGANFTHTAVHAGRRLRDSTIERHELPATSGLLIWEAPVAEIKVPSHPVKMPVTAAGWSLIPGGLWINAYGPPDQVITGSEPAEVRRIVGWLIPWAVGQPVAFGPQELPENAEFLRALISTWLLIRQPGFTEETDEPVHADIRRSYKKTGRSVPKVHVYHIRRKDRAVKTANPEDTTTRNYTNGWTVGWETGGFWRDYWTGQGRSIRDRRFIEPYVARQDLPLKEHDPIPTVKVLK